MAKEVFNTKRSIFYGPLEKELSKRLVKFFVWSVTCGADLDTTTEWAKTIGSISDVDMEKDGACKMDRQKKSVLQERMVERRIPLELIKKRKRNWLDHWRRRNCLLKDALEEMVNGMKVRGRIRYQILDNIMINGLYEDTRRKAKKRVEWRMLSLQWKTCPLAEHCDWLIIFVLREVCSPICRNILFLYTVRITYCQEAKGYWDFWISDLVKNLDGTVI